ncbi:hypothetical protein [Gracilimonas sp.]|uniref:hypothetical protein n=1 Tax=Gracilimonas sp. TaxID=1974203 RepID=UPI002871E9C9|nr:hypothetical protein [Gracilimonas sp.]
MNKTFTTRILIIVGVFFLTTEFANAQMAVGIKAGSAGIGGDFTYSVNDKLNARVSGTFFSYDMDGVYDDDPDIAYDMTSDVTSVGAIVDFYPFSKGLKLSGGIFYHDFIIDGGATPNEPYEFSDTKTFEPDRLGSLRAKVDYESKIVPYAGLGFGNPVAKGNKLKLNVELGAMYTNSPNVTMEGTGMIAPTANQDQDFEDGLKDFKFYPVLNLGLTYRF